MEDGTILIIAIIFIIAGAGGAIGFAAANDYYDARVIVFIDYIDILEKYNTANLQSENITLTQEEIIIFGKVSNMRMELTP